MVGDPENIKGSIGQPLPSSSLESSSENGTILVNVEIQLALPLYDKHFKCFPLNLHF